MPSIEVLTSPWLNKFKTLIASTRNHFIFTSPFIKYPAVKMIMDSKCASCHIHGITSFRLRSFERGASDLNAIKLLYENGAILKNIANLHAKIYVFDRSCAIISSANLTPAGLNFNIEMGLYIKDRTLVKKIGHYVESISADTTSAFSITDEIINESQNILNSIPCRRYDQADRKRKANIHQLETMLFKKDDSSEDKIFQAGIPAIIKGLSGWRRDVFQCLVNIKGNEFSLKDIYKHENMLFKNHPDNFNVRAKIRQQLQLLRDVGLLEFTERGVYRKLWA